MTEIEQLKGEIERLTAENKRLKGLLDSHGISWQPVQMLTNPMDGLVSATHTDVLVRGRSQDTTLSPPPQERDATALPRPTPMDTVAEKSRRISLFMKLFWPDEIFTPKDGKAEMVARAMHPSAEIAGNRFVPRERRRA